MKKVYSAIGLISSIAKSPNRSRSNSTNTLESDPKIFGVSLLVREGERETENLLFHSMITVLAL